MTRRTSLLIDEHPLQVLPKFAAAVGLNIAMWVQQVHYWQMSNSSKVGKVVGDRKWIYNTIEDWLEQFPFWSYSTLQRTIAEAAAYGLVYAATPGSTDGDHGRWFTVNHAAIAVIEANLDAVLASAKAARSRADARTPAAHDAYLKSLTKAPHCYDPTVADWHHRTCQIGNLLRPCQSDTFLKGKQRLPETTTTREAAPVAPDRPVTADAVGGGGEAKQPEPSPDPATREADAYLRDVCGVKSPARRRQHLADGWTKAALEVEYGRWQHQNATLRAQGKPMLGGGAFSDSLIGRSPQPVTVSKERPKDPMVADPARWRLLDGDQQIAENRTYRQALAEWRQSQPQMSA